MITIWDQKEPWLGFNPRFYGEAGRTQDCLLSRGLQQGRFNPRFYGEAGRTTVYLIQSWVSCSVSIPDFMGRPVEPGGINMITIWDQKFQSPILWGGR